MPIEGFPDANIHRICVRCKKWHEPAEGRTIRPDTGSIGAMLSPLTAFVVGLRGLTVGPNKPRFICFRCYKIRMYTRLSLFAIFAGVLVTILLLERFGLLK
ncbi:MAG: hypothetical protein JW709_01280 [Sedimentisphaerales bacterium]|nr:hypothetical protein [Sedimentisphaerales bacterium]